jgi:uncharacterized repeat protein (TIGR01451 family)
MDLPPLPGMPPAPPGMDMPPPPLGMDEAPPAPPDLPPAPPGMDMPPPPPGMDEAPPAPPDLPPAPPGMDMPPPPPGMDEAPPAPPEMPPAPPDMPPPPPGMDEAPPAPPEMPPAPPDMPPPPPGMDEAPPAPPEMPPAPPEMPPPPPGMDEAPSAPPEMPPAPPDMPPPPPGMDEAPPAPLEESGEDDSDSDTAEEPMVDPFLSPLADDALLAPPAPPESVGEDGEESPEDSDSDGETELSDLDPLTPVGTVEEDDFVSAGAKIRQSRSVDEVIGDKLEGNLHEIETATLTASGDIVKQDVKGVITVSNPSSSDRIFDIDVLLNNIGNTDIGGDHIAVDELESSKEFTTKYKVKGARMLILRERLDTNPDRDQERSLSAAMGEGGKISLELEVENVSAVSLEEVSVSRDIPSPMILDNTATATVDGNTLTWDVGSLAPGETQILAVSGSLSVDSIKPIKAGSASATYKSKATLSTLAFRELDAFCRGFAYMNVVEDERPDNWRCKTIFENRSSFAVDLVKLQVKMKGSDDFLFNITDVSQDVLPDSKWESEVKVVETNEKPDFTYELGYTVLPKVAESTEGSLKLEQSILEVLDAKVEKHYSKTVLPSYRTQDLMANIVIANTGSSPINLMRLTDDVPGLFAAPALDTITVKVGGSELSDDQFKAELSEGVTIEKELRSPDGAGHTLMMTVGTRGPIGLAPGKLLEISYPLTAPDPTPANEKVAGPLRCEFSAERFGPICMSDVVESPLVRVRHNRRNFSAGKSVMPIGGKGRYEVLIIFENNGDTPLLDVSLNDLLPSNFEIKNWSVQGAGGKRDDVDMATSDEDDNTAITWAIPQVECNERVEVCFEIKGDGEVNAEQLNKFHGATFGDEVEDDTPPIADEPSTDDSSDDSEEGSTGEAGEGFKWREDVLEKVMAAHGIEERDTFVNFAVDFDHDGNQYLKKSELEDAAKAWVEAAGTEELSEDDSSVEEPSGEQSVEEAPVAEEEAVVEESTDETPAEDSQESDDESKACPVCQQSNNSDATLCVVCAFAFD